DLVDGSSGATSVDCLVDGAVAGSGGTFSVPMTEAGMYTLSAVARDGVCSDTAAPVTAYAGVCTPLTQANWFFGTGYGLDFSSGTPAVNFNTNAYFWDNSASISDAAGNLLFYTNGLTDGAQVVGGIWNRNHQLMPNGQLGDPSCANLGDMYIVPEPGNADRYYVFTVACQGNQNFGGLRYHIVDMTADGGLGDVVQKNVLLHFDTFKELAVTRHCNGRDYWIVNHQFPSGQWHAYLLTPAGLQSPVVSSQPNPLHFGLGLKISPDGRWLAKSHADGVRLFRFDNATGQLSNAVTRVYPAFSPRDVAFDSRSNFLYVTGYHLNFGFRYRVYQYDLNAPNWPQSEVLAAETYSPYGFLWDMELAVDNRIYLNSLGKRHLGVIRYPSRTEFQTIKIHITGCAGTGWIANHT
ncbi:MAG: hypothetical protein AAF570_26100, partial [Bacteroidota bacterium]